MRRERKCGKHPGPIIAILRTDAAGPPHSIPIYGYPLRRLSFYCFIKLAAQSSLYLIPHRAHKFVVWLFWYKFVQLLSEPLDLFWFGHLRTPFLAIYSTATSRQLSIENSKYPAPPNNPPRPPAAPPCPPYPPDTLLSLSPHPDLLLARRAFGGMSWPLSSRPEKNLLYFQPKIGYNTPGLQLSKHNPPTGGPVGRLNTKY